MGQIVSMSECNYTSINNPVSLLINCSYNEFSVRYLVIVVYPFSNTRNIIPFLSEIRKLIVDL